MKLLMLAAILFFVAAFFIISEQNLHLGNTEEMQRFVDIYYAWLTQVFERGVEITAYAVSLDWLPNTNVTNSTIEQVKWPD